MSCQTCSNAAVPRSDDTDPAAVSQKKKPPHNHLLDTNVQRSCLLGGNERCSGKVTAKGMGFRYINHSRGAQA
jgi:hypothetical protein